MYGLQNTIVEPSWMAALSPLFVLLVLWSIPWKAWALWHAAQRCQKLWFIALLVINTAGILEMLYIFIFSKKTKPVCACSCDQCKNCAAQSDKTV